MTLRIRTASYGRKKRMVKRLYVTNLTGLFCRDFHLVFLDFHTKTCLKEGGRVWRNTMRLQAILLRKFTDNGHDRF